MNDEPKKKSRRPAHMPIRPGKPSQTPNVSGPGNSTIRNSNPKVEAYLRKNRKWREELNRLRQLILECPLTEEFKWSKPCYTFEKSNILILIPLKESCALMFTKGALLKDTEGILIKPGENTQAGRWIKFTALREIVEREAVLNDYIREAIEVEKAGLKVEFKKTSEFIVPEEFQNELNKNPALKKAFQALTPGRQRAYLLHFAVPKQSKTRTSRVEKWTQQILQGKGMHDE